jgi:signal transduction histidine kinase
MQALVDELLLLARADAGMIGRTRSIVDLDDTVEAVLALRRFEHERLDLDVDGTGVRPVQVMGEPTLLEQVVRNLLDNAVRHASHEVRVALTEEAGQAVLTVDDDGPGIPVEQRDEVFQRFTRLDASRDRHDGGVGLGLAIVADVVRSHGGTVSVGDSPIGGARMTVRLPAGGGSATRENRPVAAVWPHAASVGSFLIAHSKE